MDLNFKRIIPVLLLKDGQLVKTVKFKKNNYIGDPINAIKIFNEKEVDELVILDIDSSSKQHDINFKLIEDIASECFMPISYGGGILNKEQANQIISLGVEKIIVNTGINSDYDLAKEISNEIGVSSLVASIDFKKNFFTKNYNIYVKCGTEKLKVNIIDHIRILSDFCGEFLINSIDRDGTKIGYDLELLNFCKDKILKPIVFCGGAKNYENIIEVLNKGVNACAAGSLFVYHDNTDSVLISYNHPLKTNTLEKD